MSTFDNLQRALEAAKQLHVTYKQLSNRKEQAEADAHGEEDGARVRRELQALAEIKQQAMQLIAAGQRLQEQVNAAYSAVEAEISQMQSDADDMLSDISLYAEDWPAEIDAVTEDLNQWLADEGKSAVTSCGAHHLYR